MNPVASNDVISGRARKWPRVLASTVLFGLLVVLLLVAGDGALPATAAEPSKRVRVVAVGDIACSPREAVRPATCRHADVAALAERLQPSQTLLVGDIQYNVGSLSSYRASFAPAFARLSNTWRPAPGNHEYYTPGASGYFDFFGSSAGPDRRGWYSFDAGSWHIVSLNSNCAVVGCGRSSQQLRWLRDDLSRSRSKCTLAYWHHPIVSSGGYGRNRSVAPLWAELQRHRAELVIAGHEHSYERFLPLASNGKRSRRHGMREIVVGTGGKSLYALGEPRAASAVRRAAFGALALDLMRNKLTWKFVSTDDKVLDRGRLRCR